MCSSDLSPYRQHVVKGRCVSLRPLNRRKRAEVAVFGPVQVQGIMGRGVINNPTPIPMGLLVLNNRFRISVAINVKP